MNQEDIFRLLLLTLLIANRQLDAIENADSENTSAATTTEAEFNYTPLNDLLILAMFLRLFDDSTCDRLTEDLNTTF